VHGGPAAHKEPGALLGGSGFLAGMFDGLLAVDGTNEPSASVDVGRAHIFGFRCAR